MELLYHFHLYTCKRVEIFARLYNNEKSIRVQLHGKGGDEYVPTDCTCKSTNSPLFLIQHVPNLIDLILK